MNLYLYSRNFFVSTFQSGGPYIEVLTGRRDAVSGKKERADNQLPTYDISVSEFTGFSFRRTLVWKMELHSWVHNLY